MLVLDTDVFSLVVRGSSPEAERARSRIRASDQPDAVTIVTVEEQLRGRIAACHRAGNPDAYIDAARRLRETLDDCGRITILDFDDRAAEHFRRLKAAKVRVGTMDLRIAAVVLANDATLVTRNLSDFRRVPGLRAEDWTQDAGTGHP